MIFTHKENKILPYKADLLYNIIADVENYPHFIPWVSGVEVLRAYENKKDFEIQVDFKLIKEKFSTTDTFYKNERIEIVLLEGPFNKLNSNWSFKKIDDHHTLVDFDIELELKSKSLSFLFMPLFGKAQQKIFNSFEDRAKAMAKFS
ncbi:Type II toxin-antitoxin system RatA family toxin [Candidatus Hepatincolaceae symbiont of Richtersius coronifer]